MNHLKSSFALWLGMLAVCLLPVGAPAAWSSPSGIVGQIDAPALDWNVEVFSAGTGKELADVQADANGCFAVNLPPGNYLLTPIGTPPPPTPGHPMPMFIVLGPSAAVTVTRNHYTYVVLPLEASTPN